MGESQNPFACVPIEPLESAASYLPEMEAISEVGGKVGTVRTLSRFYEKCIQ